MLPLIFVPLSLVHSWNGTFEYESDVGESSADTALCYYY